MRRRRGAAGEARAGGAQVWVLDLAGPAASFVTGSSLVMDGGWTAR